ncbi:MAG TPA: hypothetical protein VEF36_10895 [Roseiarcus sp.]|nr:hypothetical protein [Roseiarcus sp.]
MRQAFIPALFAGALLVGAPARAEDNPACAKYEEPLAYNACLARLGPHAPATRAVAAPDDDAGPGAGRRRAHGRFEVSRGRHRRMRAEFDDAGRRGGDGD